MPHFTEIPGALDFVSAPSSLMPDDREAWLLAAPPRRPAARIGWGQALRQIGAILSQAVRG